MKHLKPKRLILAILCLIFSCSDKDKQAKPVFNFEYHYIVDSCDKNVSWSRDGENWSPVKRDMKLEKESYVETGKASILVLKGSLGDRVIIDEESKARLTVEHLSQYAEKSGIIAKIRGIRIYKGIASFSIQSNEGKFFVETPSALVRVDGTSFSVRYKAEQGKTDVDVYEGVVNVNVVDKKGVPSQSTDNQHIVLKKGESVHGITQSLLPKKHRISQKEIDEWFKSIKPSPAPKKPIEIKKTEIKKTKAKTTNSALLIKQQEKEKAIREALELELKKKQKISAERRALAANKAAEHRALEEKKRQANEEMNKEKEKFKQESAQIKNDLARHKNTVRTDLENTRTQAKKALQTERENARKQMNEERRKFRNETGSNSSPSKKTSEDPFEELNRMKINQ